MLPRKAAPLVAKLPFVARSRRGTTPQGEQRLVFLGRKSEVPECRAHALGGAAVCGFPMTHHGPCSKGSLNT